MHDAWHLMTAVHSSPIGLFCGSSDGFVSSIFVQTFRRAVWTPSRNDKPTGEGYEETRRALRRAASWRASLVVALFPGLFSTVLMSTGRPGRVRRRAERRASPNSKQLIDLAAIPPTPFRIGKRPPAPGKRPAIGEPHGVGHDEPPKQTGVYSPKPPP